MGYFLRYLRKHYIIAGFLALILLLFIVIRLYMDVWLSEYVNGVLNNIEGYQGSVEAIHIDLYRSAYRIDGLKINKKNGNIPTPFIAIEEADFSLQWSALIHGRIVSDVNLTAPVLNFAFSKSAKQTGDEVDWTKPIKDLMPIDINRVTFTHGSLSYQDFSTHPQVNIYIHNVKGNISNLRNVQDTGKTLPSNVVVSGESIGGGKLEIRGKMDILKPVPDMDLLTKLENVSLPALSNYSDAYAAFDFKSGEFSLYSELIVKDSHVSGYIKPIATHIQIVDLHKTSNPIKIAWESIVSAIITVFTNHTHDQFATKIELEGSLDNISTNTWSAIGGILDNAFVSALHKGLEHNSENELQDKDHP